MPTYLIALLVSLLLVVLFVIGIGGVSMLFGVLSQIIERPKLKFLKSSSNANLAFFFDWPSTKDNSKIDYIKLSLYNPFGNPTRSELVRSFAPQTSTFAHEISIGQPMLNFLGAQGFNKSEVAVELGSSKEGINYQFSYKGSKFLDLLKNALTSKEDEQKVLDSKTSKNEFVYEVPKPSFIASPTQEQEGMQLVIPNNPAFQKLFAGSGGSGESSAAGATQNFKVAKVWIEPGCIVCNACEGTYPEVFEVKPDTCVIRPTAPLDNGLKIKEAAEGCPVEVIKFTVA